jgi:hypothetical protein
MFFHRHPLDGELSTSPFGSALGFHIEKYERDN